MLQIPTNFKKRHNINITETETIRSGIDLIPQVILVGFF